MKGRLQAYVLHMAPRFGVLAGVCGLAAASALNVASPGWIATGVGLGAGALFALALALVCAPMDYLKRTRVAARYGTWSVDSRQERRLQIAGMSPQAAVDSLAEALSGQRDFVVHRIDRDQALLELRRRPTWQSFGDRIAVRIVQQGGRLEAIVVSRPRIGSTIIDYGQNLENVERVSALLQTRRPEER